MDWDELTNLSNTDTLLAISEKYGTILDRYWEIVNDKDKGPAVVRSMFLNACDNDKHMKMEFITYTMSRRGENDNYPLTCNEVLRFVTYIKYEFEKAAHKMKS